MRISGAKQVNMTNELFDLALPERAVLQWMVKW